MASTDAATRLVSLLRALGIVALAFMLLNVPAHARDQAVVSLASPGAQPLTLPKHKSITVITREDVAEITVGDSSIADVTPLTSSSFYVVGRDLGRTNIVAYDNQRRVIGVLDIEITVDLQNLAQTLRQVLPGSSLTVRSVNGQIHLSGTVPDAVMAEKAMSVARQYGAENIINAIRIASSQQVLLEVRFIEASRNAARELGISWSANGSHSAASTGAFPTGSGAMLDFGGLLPSGAVPFGTVVARLLDGGVSVDVLIQALEQKGLARRLAEPNLVALSGETASFLAGGEVPVPSQGSEGSVSVQFKEYGVKLSFTPVVLDGGLINLRLEPEVSQVDFNTMVEADGIEIPGLITRRTSTVVELKDGQSFAIAGLFQSVDSRRQNQLPWIGQIPVLGALFRSQSFQREETDLVIIVTPHLVGPVDPGSVLATPHDATRLSNDVEFFLLGQQEVGPSLVKTYMENTPVLWPHGHIVPGKGGRAQ